MVKTILRLAGEHEKLAFVADQRGHPTFAADLAPMLVRFVVERLPGTWHVTNQGAVTWYEFAQAVLDGRRRRSQPGRSDHHRRAPAAAPRAAACELRARQPRARVAGIELLPDFRESLPALVAQIRAT